MMQDYDFSNTDTFPFSASTSIQPSEQILQNIMSFARCYQNVDAAGMRLKIFLN